MVTEPAGFTLRMRSQTPCLSLMNLPNQSVDNQEPVTIMPPTSDNNESEKKSGQPELQGRQNFPYSAVLWDIDGTLADSEPMHELAFAKACRELGLAYENLTDTAFLGSTEENTHRWLMEKHGVAISFKEWSNLRFKHFMSIIEGVNPHKDALDTWHKLENLGTAQAVVSNADRMVVQANLEQLGLVMPGLVSISRNDVKEGKPNPEPYLRAAHLLGVHPSKCAAVEDSGPGAESARGAGMRVFVMPWFESKAKHEYESLESLKRMVEQQTG